MLKRWRIRKAHSRFLEACRNLDDGRAYWRKSKGPVRWFLELILPVPLMGLHEDGRPILCALEWLEANCRKACLDEAVIREYHRLVYVKDPAQGGKYRDYRVDMGPRNPLRPPPPNRVPALMRHLELALAEYQRRFDAMNGRADDTVLEFALKVYHRIGTIHPFPDGNGRVARLSMNHLTRRYGGGYVILPPLSESPPLWEALLQAGRDDLEPLTKIGQGHLHRI